MVETVVTAARTESVVELGRVSPAAHLGGLFAAAEVSGSRGVRVRELPFLTMVGLRVEPGSAAAERAQDLLGAALPARCGAVAAAGDSTVLWLSPDEFLLVSGDQPTAVTQALMQALDGGPGSATDLSANRTTFELAGPMAREVLEKGCPLDLHPRQFEPGTAYLTVVGAVPVILWKIADEEYRVLPRSSYADFLGRWLLDAIAEFKAPEIP